MSDEDLKKLIESNAKAIQALTEAVNQDRQERRKDREEWRQDRRRVFEWMSRLAAAQADFYEVQSDYLRHIETIEDRLTDILDRLIPKQE